MKKELEVEISGIAYGGRGVARLEGKVCFVEGALPGEKIRFIQATEKQRFITGRVTKILRAADSRITPVCPYYGKCGGCQYQHLNYKQELFYKNEQVKDLLARIGGFKECDLTEITASTFDYGYRSSITVHKSPAGYGYFAADNKTIITIGRCALAKEAINNALGTLSVAAGKQDMTIKCDQAGNVKIKSYPGHRFFKDNFLGTELIFSPRAFSQVNRDVAIAIVNTLRALMEKEKRSVLFDFYCGMGFFGMLLRDLFETVVGVDESRVAIDAPRLQKRTWTWKTLRCIVMTPIVFRFITTNCAQKIIPCF